MLVVDKKRTNPMITDDLDVNEIKNLVVYDEVSQKPLIAEKNIEIT